MNNYKTELKNIKTEWMCNKLIAHRGLWSEDIAENTITAFENAVNHGFAIETDVWRLKDDTLVIFHDDDLTRLCGVNKKITDIENTEELKTYKIKGKDTIPTLDELLEVVNGKVELLIEIKTYEFNGKTEKLIYEKMKSYKGKYAIESFNFNSVMWFKKNAPEVVRGQLSGFFENNKAKGSKKFLLMLMKRLFFNPFNKPHFIAYDKKHYPNKYILKSRKKNISIILWTIQSQEEYDQIKSEVDNVIFDGFVPKNTTN